MPLEDDSRRKQFVKQAGIITESASKKDNSRHFVKTASMLADRVTLEE